MFSVHGTGDLYKSAHHSRHGHKSFIPESAIGSLKSLGGGRYGTVQQGIWTTDGGQKVSTIMMRQFFISNSSIKNVVLSFKLLNYS